MATPQRHRSHEEEVEELLDTARRYDERAEAMRTQARELAHEAARLRVEVEQLRRPRVEILPTAYHSSRDERTRGRILEMLGGWGRCTIPQVARQLQIKEVRVRSTMAALERDGEVARVGVGAGTLYTLPSELDPDERGRMGGSAVAMIRDAARTLDVFSYAELRAEVAVLSDSTLRRYLPQLVTDGTLSEERLAGSLTKVYAYNHPTGGSPARAKVPTPEAQLVAREARRSTPIAGTGEKLKVRKDVAELLEAITAAGAEIERASRHWKVSYGGQVIGTVPGTPSDHRSLMNCRAQLRRNGLDLG